MVSFMIEKIAAIFFLIVLGILLHGAALIVIDRERAYAERQALRKQAKNNDCQNDQAKLSIKLSSRSS